MQAFIDTNDGSVRLYHTWPSKAGTDQFECGGRVLLTSLTRDRQGRYVAVCPAGCGATAFVPLTGDTDAQRLHAHARLADPAHPAKTLVDAIESVLLNVHERNGVPSLELGIEALTALNSVPSGRTLPTLAALYAQREAMRARAVQQQEDQAAIAAAKVIAELPEDVRAAVAQLLQGAG